MPGYSASSARAQRIAPFAPLAIAAQRDQLVVPRDRAEHRRAQLLVLERLVEEAEDLALVDAVDRGLERALAGEQDPHGLGADASRLAGELRAGHLRHVVVGHQHRDLFLRDRRERVRCGQRAPDVQLLALEAAHDGGEHRLVVVDAHDQR